MHLSPQPLIHNLCKGCYPYYGKDAVIVGVRVSDVVPGVNSS